MVGSGLEKKKVEKNDQVYSLSRTRISVEDDGDKWDACKDGNEWVDSRVN